MSIKFSDARKTKDITLPSYEGSVVTLYSSIRVKDLDNMDLLTNPDTKAVIENLPKLIKSWNFVGEDNQPIPVNSDTVKELPIPDIMFIMNEFTTFVEQQKKSTPTS